ncbi:MAG: copper resistance protein NlpE [Methylococcaceae bacterium]
MKTVKQTLAFFGVLFFANATIAATDLSAQQKFLEARVATHQQGSEHANHLTPVEESKKFHGVFYGFLPCDNCNGIKATLSLKDNNNYLLVTQPAKESSREFYEKGKYSWDDENNLVLLTPKNHESTTRQYRIKDEGTLIQLNDEGKQYTGEKADSYILRRSDTVQTREVHIH